MSLLKVTFFTECKYTKDNGESKDEKLQHLTVGNINKVLPS
jgi:hypothetical protein